MKTVGIIHTNGTSELREVASDYTGIQSAIGGFFQPLTIPHFRGGAYVDEEGLLKGLPVNLAMHDAYNVRFSGPVVLHFNGRDTTQADLDSVMNPTDEQARKVYALYTWTP